MNTKVKNSVLWGLFIGAFFIALNSLFDSKEDQLPDLELYTHAVLLSIVVAFFQWLLKEQTVLYRLAISDRWKFQLSEGLNIGLFLSAWTLLDKDNQSIVLELTTPKFYLKTITFIVLFVFGWAYHSWKQRLKIDNID